MLNDFLKFQRQVIEKYDYRTAKGWLRPEEREFLFGVAQVAGDNGVIVNIGTEYGASLVCLRMGNYSCSIYGLDIDNSKAPHDLRIHYFDGDSGKWVVGLAVWLKKPIDVLFIDGDHTYEGVVADTPYTEQVRAGGYAIFHDCYDYDKPYAVQGWYLANKDWQELGPIGTMRVFRRRNVSDSV